MGARALADTISTAHIYQHASPVLIPTVGLAVWLDASQITGKVNADVMGTWADVSGNNRNFAVASGSPTYRTNVINGKPVVRFGASIGFTGGDLSSVFTSAASLIIIHTGTLTSSLIEDASRDIHWSFSGTGYWGTFRATRAESWPPSVPTSGHHSFYIISSAAAYSAYIDKVLVGSPPSPNFACGSNLRLGQGSNSSFAGDVAEVILYNRAIDSADRAIIDAYISTKYGI